MYNIYNNNGTNRDYLCIRIATVGNTIQTVNSPCMNTDMSTACNTANALVSTLLSQRISTLCQPGISAKLVQFCLYIM